MDKLDHILEKFKVIKEELAKNINASYSGEPNKLSMSEETYKDEKGIHGVSNPSVPGRSKMGLMNSIGAPKEAKAEAKRTLKELKNLPKPKLVKEEDVDKSEEYLQMFKNGQWSLEKKHIGFKNLEHKLEGEGHSQESAKRIAASIGQHKYGASEMAHAAATGHAAHKSEDDKE